MENVTKNKSVQKIREIIKQINSSWLEGRPEKLEDLFHENMMIVSSDLAILGSGRDACVESYAEFIKRANVIRFDQSETEVHIWGNTAIASYKFEMTYEMKNKKNIDSGQDLFAFTCQNGKWLAVWRKIIS